MLELTGNLVREVVHDATISYLAPDLDPAQPPDVAGMFEEQGVIADPVTVSKAQRYAVLAARIHLLMGGAVEGDSDKARFVADVEPDPNIGDQAFALGLTVQQCLLSAARRLKRDDPRYGYFIDESLRLTSESRRPPLEVADPEFVDRGSNLGPDGSQFVRLTDDVMAANRKTAIWEPEQRLAVAHQLLPVVIRRALVNGQHLNSIPPLRRFDSTNTELHLKDPPTLKQTGGRNLSSPPREVVKRVRMYGPIIRCPAHQLLFSDETALERAMHGVVNLGFEQGFYASRHNTVD